MKLKLTFALLLALLCAGCAMTPTVSPEESARARADFQEAAEQMFIDAWNVDAIPMNSTLEPVTAMVVVARSGRVLSAKMNNSSGNGLADQSIQNALDSVKSVAPLPAGTKKSRMTLEINFHLQTREVPGTK